MRSTINKWGNSYGVRIPKSIFDEGHFEVGEEVDVTYDSQAKAINIKHSVIEKEEMTVGSLIAVLRQINQIQIIDGAEQILGIWKYGDEELTRFYEDAIEWAKPRDKVYSVGFHDVTIKLSSIYVWGIQSYINKKPVLTRLFDCTQELEAKEAARYYSQHYFGTFVAEFMPVSIQTYNDFMQNDGWCDEPIWIVYHGTEDVAQCSSEEEAISKAQTLNEAYGTNSHRVQLVPDYWTDK